MNKINPNLKAHIPNFRVTRLGIIRNVLTEILLEEIKECAVSSAPIVEAKRFEWKDKEGNPIPGTTVMLTFDGQTLPQDIKLYFLLLRVDPYISQPKICYSCYRHGHVKSICENPRCLYCGEKPHDTGLICPKISNDPKCFNCNGPHWATDKSCHKYADEKEIRKIAAYKNIGIKSAAYLHNREKSSPGSIPNLLHRPSSHQNPTPNLAIPHIKIVIYLNLSPNIHNPSTTFTRVNPALLVMEFFLQNASPSSPPRSPSPPSPSVNNESLINMISSLMDLLQRFSPIISLFKNVILEQIVKSFECINK